MNINIPPDRKPRVAALTFVKNIFDTKSIKREVSAHFNLFFLLRGNSMVFLFLIISCCGNEVFSGLQVQKTEAATSACELFIFPRLPVEIGTVQPSNACCTAFAVVFNMPLHILM